MSDMSINGVSGYGSPYGSYGGYGSYDGYGGYGNNYGGYGGAGETEGPVAAKEQQIDTGECETCKRRKYQDGSDEMVSFKAAGHIDPNNAASVVMSHEQEHVSNAFQKADLEGGEVVRANVRLKTDICPECGRTYISGGVTSTQIRYVNETNPYQQDLKSSDVSKYRGANVDIDAG